jgi:hypothetical protein
MPNETPLAGEQLGLTLSIAPDLNLPIDAVTQKFAWLGRSGGGKTYGLKRFVERMLLLKVQVVVLDSVGVWAGLRLGPQGFDVPVIGGLYGDIPLEPTSGALMAEVVVSHGSSMVLDTSQMIDAQRARFCEAFGRRLFELKKQTPGAMHIVLDEGQDVLPQNVNEGEKMMLHEWVRIAKQGRAFGMGLSIATQRPQEVNKKALNQAECVFAFQLTGSHERKALEYWLADKGMSTKLSDTLTTLDIGRPFVWSPQWLKISRIIERIHPILSADTSKTPQFGDAPQVARTMRPIDLGALRTSMAAATEELKANDPKLLRARIKELEKLVADPQAAPVVVFDKKKAEKLRDSYDKHAARTQQLLQWEHQELREIFDRIEKLHRNATFLEQHLEINTLAEDLGAFLDDIRTTAPPIAAPKRATETVLSTKPARTPRIAPPPDAPKTEASDLARSDRLMLQVLAQHGAMPLTRCAMLAGYPITASTTKNGATRLRGLGYIEGNNSEISITPLGSTKLGPIEKLPKGAKALLDYWCARLSKVDEQMLRALAKSYPKSMLYPALATAAGYDPDKSTAKNSATRLRGLGLIEGSNTKGILISKELAK